MLLLSRLNQTLCTKPSDEVALLPRSVIMVETSGTASLDPRQACSVEAAARRSGLGVVVVMMNEKLDLTDNTTCFLLNIQFYSVNMTSLGRNTSLGSYQLCQQSEVTSVLLQKHSSVPQTFCRLTGRIVSGKY